MSGNDVKVLIDLNSPSFQDDFFDLDPSEIKKIIKTPKKIRGMTWNMVFSDKGLKWEEIKSIPGKYSIRLSQSYRAVVTREGLWMRFSAINQDHDQTYGKK